MTLANHPLWFPFRGPLGSLPHSLLSTSKRKDMLDVSAFFFLPRRILRLTPSAEDPVGGPGSYKYQRVVMGMKGTLFLIVHVTKTRPSNESIPIHNPFWILETTTNGTLSQLKVGIKDTYCNLAA